MVIFKGVFMKFLSILFFCFSYMALAQEKQQENEEKIVDNKGKNSYNKHNYYKYTEECDLFTQKYNNICIKKIDGCLTKKDVL